MTQQHNDREKPQDEELHGYERMLDRLRHALDDFEASTAPRFRYALQWARDQAVELGELTWEQADRVAGYVRRDVEGAADWSSRRDEDLAGWLRMDITLVERWIWDRFSSVADQTRLDWLRFQASLKDAATYHTGEIAAPGVLACDNCGNTLNFRKAGHIPPCGRCRGTSFHRPVE